MALLASEIYANSQAAKCAGDDECYLIPYRNLSVLYPKECSAWHAMKKRCLDSKCPEWKNYGARGIKVCQRWLDSFRNFLIDIGPKPALHLSLDRIDNNGNYEPGNVRWATIKTQSRNKRTNYLITYQGEIHCVTDWGKLTGLHPTTIRTRIRRGWSIADALTTANDAWLRLFTYNGKTQRLTAWAKELGLDFTNILAPRINRGWSFEKAITTPVGKYERKK